MQSWWGRSRIKSDLSLILNDAYEQMCGNLHDLPWYFLVITSKNCASLFSLNHSLTTCRG